MTLRSRRAWARWLIALLLLPIVLGVIPLAPLSTEQALARDLGLSICTPNAAQDQSRAPDSHDRQCALCTAGCVTCTTFAPVSTVATPIPAPLSGAFIFTPIAAAEPHGPLWRDGEPARGPPVSVNI